MKTHWKTYLIGAAGLFWCFGMIALYYTSHKPFNAELAINLLLLVWRIGVAFGVCSLAGGFGGWLLKKSSIHFENKLWQLALQAGLGLGVLGTVILLLGASLGVSTLILAIFSLILVLLFWKDILNWWRLWAGWKDLWTESGRFEHWLAVLMVDLALPALFVSLAPPVKFDALLYHLVMPQAYLQQGKITYLPWIVMSGMPQVTEMLYTWAIALAGNQAAAVLGCFTGVITLTGLAGYLRQQFDARSAWLGMASLLAGFTTAAALGWAYVDWLGLFFGLGCLVALDLWRQGGDRKILFLAGLFAGFAAATKYTAGVLGLVCGLALAWHCWRAKRNVARTWMVFGLGAVLAFMAWPVKNWITVGNPFYPFFISSGAMDPIRLAVYQGLPPWGDWQDFFLLPLRATYLGVDSAAGYSVSLGPLLFGLGALVWIGWKNRPAEQKASLENAALIAVFGLAAWAVGNRLSGYLIQTRMYFCLFPSFAVLAAAGFDGLSHQDFGKVRLGRILSALVFLVLFLNLIEVGSSVLRQGVLPAMFGIQSKQDYLAQNLGWFQPAMSGVNQLPAGSKTLLLFEPRSLYCAPGCFPDEILDRWKRDHLSLGKPQAILDAWRQEGFDHVLFYKAGADFMRETADPHITESDWRALDEFLAGLPTPVDYGGVYLLYTLPH
jgi:hypothetical protein